MDLLSLGNCENTNLYIWVCYYYILFNKEGEDKIYLKIVLIIEEFCLKNQINDKFITYLKICWY